MSNNPSFYNGSTIIELDKDDIAINFKHEELTNHHKGEYDYVTYRTIKFRSEKDAEFIYREMKNLLDLGYW